MATAAAAEPEAEVWHVTKVPEGTSIIAVARGFHDAVVVLEKPPKHGEFGQKMKNVLFGNINNEDERSSAATVTDAELMTLYKVGVKWMCAYITPKTPLWPGNIIPKKWSLTLSSAAGDGGGLLQQVHVCPIKPKLKSKEERLNKIAADRIAKAAAKAKREAKKPAWRIEQLERFPQRGTTLCQHAQVSALPPELALLIERVYLPCMFPASCSEVALYGS